MKTELIETGPLSAQLTIVLEAEDYKKDFDKEILKYKSKAHLKGFRKGQTPLTAIKKMYGKSVLADVINEKLQSNLSNYLTENEIDILGNPIASDNQSQIDFDLKELKDFEFIFDLGLAPKVDIVGADSSATYTDYKVTIDESLVDEEITSLQKRMGEQIEVDEDIVETDILALEIVEKTKVEGRDSFQSEITVMPDRLVPSVKDSVIGKRLGHEMEINIFDLELNSTEDYVKKYFLKDAPEDITAEFKATVSSIKRLKPAEINEDFFTNAFGPDANITNESEAREFLKAELSDFYNEQGRSITKRYILENLIEKNDMPLPNEFLKKWLLSTNEKLTAEEVDKDYDGFSKNLKWTLIKQYVAKENEVAITHEDLKEAFLVKIKKQFAQFGGYPGINYDDMVNRLMQNQETVQKEYEELLAERVLDKVCELVTLQEKSVSLEEYKGIVKSLQENNA